MKLFHNKKGAELTMNTIIIAVLVLIVLVVIFVIFGKTATNFFLGTSGCTNKNGVCMPSPCPSGYTNHFGGNPECETRDGGRMICCIEERKLLGMD